MIDDPLSSRKVFEEVRNQRCLCLDALRDTYNIQQYNIQLTIQDTTIVVDGLEMNVFRSPEEMCVSSLEGFREREAKVTEIM